MSGLPTGAGEAVNVDASGDEVEVGIMSSVRTIPNEQSGARRSTGSIRLSSAGLGDVYSGSLTGFGSTPTGSGAAASSTRNKMNMLNKNNMAHLPTGAVATIGGSYFNDDTRISVRADSMEDKVADAKKLQKNNARGGRVTNTSKI